MSESFAVVCVVGLVLGTVAVTVLGLVSLERNKSFSLKAGRAGLDLTIICGSRQQKTSK